MRAPWSMLLLLALAALACLPAPAAAQPAPRGRKVQVHYLVVYASNESRGMDARLKPIEDSLKVLQFSGFEVVGDGEQALVPGGSGAFDLPGEHRLEVTLTDVDDERARLRVRMVTGGKPTNTTHLTIHRGGTFLYGGVRHRGGRLVVPIRVRY